MPSNAITVVHKYIRHEMFNVSQLLARASADDRGAVVDALDDIATLLHGHAAREETEFEPLLRKINAEFAGQMRDDHRKLDRQLDDVCLSAKALNLQNADRCADALRQLYLDWNRFLSAYLAHLDDEERTLFKALEGETLKIELVAEAAKSMPTEQREGFLSLLWSVVTPDERAAIEGAL